jgi:hypothetical protein
VLPERLPCHEGTSLKKSHIMSVGYLLGVGKVSDILGMVSQQGPYLMLAL